MTESRPTDATALVGYLLSGSGRPRAGAVSVVGRPFAWRLDPHRKYDCKGGTNYPNPPKQRAGPEGAGKASPAPTAPRPQTAHRVAQPETDHPTCETCGARKWRSAGPCWLCRGVPE